MTTSEVVIGFHNSCHLPISIVRSPGQFPAMAHSSSEARELARSRAQVFLDAIVGEASRQEHGESFDYTALSGLTNVRSDGPGHCAAELPVTPKVCNWLHNLHGGCTGKFFGLLL